MPDWKIGRTPRLVLLAISWMLCLPGLAFSGQIEVISKVPPRLAPATGGGDSSTILPRRQLMSADGRYLVFVSHAANLIPGQIDFNQGPDVFLRDRVADRTVLVSHAAGSPSTASEFQSGSAAISADGRYIAFTSASRDLVPGLSGFAADHLYLYEVETGIITLVSHKAGSATELAEGVSSSPVLSADGGYVAYTSEAIDLVPDQVPTGLQTNVFLFERASGTNLLVSRSAASAQQPGNGDSREHTLSADGRYVAFSSLAEDLVPGQIDSDTFKNVFLYDRITGATTLVSHAHGSPLRGVGGGSPSLNADGQYVAFVGGAADLAPGVTDTNSLNDVFLYDRLLGATSLVSRSSESPNATAPGGGFAPVISADGNAVAYFSGNTPEFGGGPLFVFDRLAGTARPVSPATPGALEVELTPNGRYIVYTSRASNAVPGQNDANGVRDVFVFDRLSGATALVSHASGSPLVASNADSLGPAVSADGSWIAFSSYSDNLAAGVKDSNARLDVFLYETATEGNRAVSLHPPGQASLTPIGASRFPSVSGDGRFIAFVSGATSLIPGQLELNGRDDVFLYDRVTKKTILVSRSSASPLATGNQESGNPVISRDGNYVAFASRATDLVPGQSDSGGFFDVFLYSRLTGATTLVSHSSASPVQGSDAESYPAAVSADGGLVVFQSTSTNLVPGQSERNGGFDVFVYERRTAAVTLVSRTARSAAQTGNGLSFFASMTPNGDLIAFTSGASDLVQGVQDTNLSEDAFLYDRRARKVSLISRSAASPRVASTGWLPLLSADGRYVTYNNDGNELTPGQAVFVDRRSGRTLLVRRGAAIVGLSANGRYGVFISSEDGVIPGQVDGNHSTDLFLFDRVSGQIRLVTHVSGSLNRTADRGGFAPRLSADGRYVAFLSESTDLTPETKLFGRDVYLYDGTTGQVVLVSRSAFSSPAHASGGAAEVVISASGGFVVFSSEANDLARRDFNGASDVFLYIP